MCLVILVLSHNLFIFLLSQNLCSVTGLSIPFLEVWFLETNQDVGWQYIYYVMVRLGLF